MPALKNTNNVSSMRFALITILVLIALTSCQKEAALSLGQNNQKKIIALQPLGNYDEQQLRSLQFQLGRFFQARVWILDVVEIPQSFRSANEERYSADSIINFLLQFKNNSVVQVVGMTHKEIYTIKYEETNDRGKIKKIATEHRIRGFGYISENACVVSDYSFKSENETLWDNRVLKAVLHEIGHNLGLAHCKNDDCLMSEKNGNIVLLQKAGGDYCTACRQKLSK